MTTLECLSLIALLISGLAVGAAMTLSNGRVARAVRQMERTYRRQKSLEMEQILAQEMERRRIEVQQELRRTDDAWREVLNQLLADAALDDDLHIGPAGLLSLSAAPSPRFAVAEAAGRILLFTTAPETLRKIGLLQRESRTIPLDADLYPTARVEVQAVWEYLAEQRIGADAPALPRQAAWYLIVEAEK
jgi:hypothetical protein